MCLFMCIACWGLTIFFPCILVWFYVKIPATNVSFAGVYAICQRSDRFKFSN